jgi:membrane protein DedA with SNARE-associated domain
MVAVPLVVLSVAGIVAGAFTPLLVREAPLLLLVLESRNRYLLLVAARVEVVPFVVVGVLRRMASDPFYYLLGRWYGDRAVAWLERRAGGGHLAADVARWFGRIADFAVVLAPGAIVCTLAGVSGMRPRRFVVLNLIGSIGAVVVMRLIADAVAGPLATIVGFSDRNAVWLTAVFAAGTVIWLLAERRRGRGPVDGMGLREAFEEDGPDRRTHATPKDARPEAGD